MLFDVFPISDVLESVIHLVQVMSWNFIEARILYDKCIEN